MTSPEGETSAVVTGGTGCIGPALVKRLLRSGYKVRIFSRRRPPEGLWPSVVEVREGDIRDAAAVKDAIAGAVVVFHLAAKLHVSHPPAALYPEYRAMNVEGTRNVVNGAVATGVRRVVYASSVTVYGPSNGKILDEAAAPSPGGIYAQTKLEGEDVVLSARSRNTSEPLGVVLRLATVYGPRQKGNLQRLVRALARRRFLPIGRGDNRRSFVYVRDVAGAMVAAAGHSSAPGGVFNVTDGRIYTMREVLASICQALGRSVPRLSVPIPLARPGMIAAEWGFRLAGRQPPFGRTALEKFLEDAAYSGERIQRDLGFRPAYDLVAGWNETIAALRAQGQL